MRLAPPKVKGPGVRFNVLVGDPSPQSMITVWPETKPGGSAKVPLRLIEPPSVMDEALGVRAVILGAWTSNAPMSTLAVPSPLPSMDRRKPRWSVVMPSTLAPASIAGLPGRGRMVRVGPP